MPVLHIDSLPPITCQPRDSENPPESFWLSKDAEFDWFDRNAFLDRKESIKANSNPVTLNQNVNVSKMSTNSVQVSAFLKSKPVVYADPKRRNCKIANILMFPKRSDSIGKEVSVGQMMEPSSPKVSCLGRVRSKRCRNRKKSEKESKNERNGFMCPVISFFRSRCYGRKRTDVSPVKMKDSSEYSPENPTAIGGATRFMSGRRSENEI